MTKQTQGTWGHLNGISDMYTLKFLWRIWSSRSLEEQQAIATKILCIYVMYYICIFIIDCQTSEI